jgi:hypothetical protein
MSSRIVFGLLFAGYTVLLGFVGFRPTPVDREASPTVWWWIRAVRRAGFEWYSYEFLEFSANVLLFVPLGLLGVLAVGLRFWWAPLVFGVAATVVIETGQAMLLPERFPSTSDVIANSIGTALGVAAGCVVLAMQASGRRSRTSAAAQATGQGRPSP